jgi:CTP:molybdopterin cytidylyltransferase MocA
LSWDAPQPGGDVVGLVLAAGAGRRMGRPKALLTDAHGRPMTDVAVDRLLAAGCEHVTVVLGAEADRARALLGDRPAGRARVVVADDWAEGMGASLRCGLAALPSAAAVLVTLVDLPDVDAAVMGRVLARWQDDGGGQEALVRATYDGVPGHPVLIGREHWAPLLVTLSGDTGAGPYLSRRIVQQVSCEDLATGRDVDRPEDLA